MGFLTFKDKFKPCGQAYLPSLDLAVGDQCKKVMAFQFSLWEISGSPCLYVDTVFSLHVPLWAGLSPVSGFSYDFCPDLAH